MCPECNVVPPAKHHCQALVAICQDCGQHHPVIADVCHCGDKCRKMPVAEGTVKGKTVKVLRDTGCSTVVVHHSLVPDNKLTGLEERCVLIDRTIRCTYIETLYFTGMTTVICMKSPIYNLIIGNIQQVRDVTIPQQALQAVQSRSQAKASRGMTPLITPVIDFGTQDLTPSPLIDNI